MINKVQKNKSLLHKSMTKGYTLLEALFYIALFAILTMAVISSLVTMTKSFKETSIQADLVQSATIMERITREVRQAYGINYITTSNLRLNTKDESNNNKTVEFLLSGSNLQLIENSILTGNLNTPNIVVTGLTFTEITTTEGKAVKMILSVRSLRDSSNRVKDFYSTIVLRGDY